MTFIENSCLLTGRILMGLYFILPAIMKITDFDGTRAYMIAHNVPLVSLLLIVTIFIQLAGGIALIVGYKAKLTAFVLAGLVLVISIFMHNFWDYPEGMELAHETQNFFKNMGIMAGLLVIAGLGTGAYSLDAVTKEAD